MSGASAFLEIDATNAQARQATFVLAPDTGGYEATKAAASDLTGAKVFAQGGTEPIGKVTAVEHRDHLKRSFVTVSVVDETAWALLKHGVYRGAQCKRYGDGLGSLNLCDSPHEDTTALQKALGAPLEPTPGMIRAKAAELAKAAGGGRAGNYLTRAAAILRESEQPVMRLAHDMAAAKGGTPANYVTMARKTLAGHGVAKAAGLVDLTVSQGSVMVEKLTARMEDLRKLGEAQAIELAALKSRLERPVAGLASVRAGIEALEDHGRRDLAERHQAYHARLAAFQSPYADGGQA